MSTVDQQALQPKLVLYMHDIHQEEKMNDKTGQKSKSPKGGSTVCALFFDDNTFALGGAFCNAMDKFSRKTGRSISYGRAMLNKQTDQHVFQIRDKEILSNTSEVKRYINQFMKGIYFFSKKFPTCNNKTLRAETNPQSYIKKDKQLVNLVMHE